MRRPEPFEITYAHDRRAHRHRCQHCRKIVNEGAPVLMWKMDYKTSRVLHIECADAKSFNGLTERQYALLHSDEYARRLGHKIPKRDFETATRAAT